MNKSLIVGVLLATLITAMFSMGITTAKPSSEVVRGVFAFYGYDSPPWYPPEEETDSYRWAPKYHWATPSITIKVNPTASPFSEG